MNENTNFRYKTARGEMAFSFDSDFWITEMDGASSVDIGIEAVQAVQQKGSSVAGQQIQPRKMTFEGTVFGDVEAHRRTILDTVLPMVPARIVLEQDGRSYFLDGYPEKTPVFSDGGGMQNFQFQFYAPYPLWQEGEARPNPFRQTVDPFMFPFYTGGRWYLSRYERMRNINVRNEGNMGVGFRVVFRILSDPSVGGNGQPTSRVILRNLTTNEELAFWLPPDLVQRGDEIEFSTMESNKVFWNNTTGGGMYPALTTMGAFDMALIPGDNILQFDYEGGEGFEVECTLYAQRGVLSGV